MDQEDTQTLAKVFSQSSTVLAVEEVSCFCQLLALRVTVLDPK